MGVTLRSACVGKLDCVFTAKSPKYVQDATGEEGRIAKVMAGIQHCESEASTACQISSDT